MPDLWEQPSFAAGKAESPSSPHEVTAPTPEATVDVLGPSRIWGQLAGGAAGLTLMFGMGGVATQMTPLFGAAILSGIATVAAVVKALGAVSRLLPRPPAGPGEQNG